MKSNDLEEEVDGNFLGFLACKKTKEKILPIFGGVSKPISPYCCLTGENCNKGIL